MMISPHRVVSDLDLHCKLAQYTHVRYKISNYALKGAHLMCSREAKIVSEYDQEIPQSQTKVAYRAKTHIFAPKRYTV